MPFLVLLIKYLKKYFTFEVQVIDDKNVKRRFRASNYQSNTRVKPFICTIPMKLDEGWNQIHFNLKDFTRKAYGTNYLETLRVQIHANCRIRRIYFTDQLLSSKSIPAEYRAFSNAQDDNAEEQYQNQLNNDPNQMMQGEEQYQAAEYEHQEEHLEEQRHMEGEHEQVHQGGEEGGEEQEQQNQDEPKNEEQNQNEQEGGNAGEEEHPKEDNEGNNNAGEGAQQEPPAEQ